MATSLPVVNLAEAKFECIFGRGCEGICCQNGRPGVYPEEAARIDGKLDVLLPELRPEARKVVEQDGYLSRRTKADLPMLRVVAGWCIFFNKGCVLHKVGAAEGDPFRYKPAPCGLFPLTRTVNDDWYVRQWGYDGEAWDLFCLNPKASPKPASESLTGEIALAERYVAEAEAKKETEARATQTSPTRKRGTPRPEKVKAKKKTGSKRRKATTRTPPR
jgi:hypothetical protein